MIFALAIAMFVAGTQEYAHAFAAALLRGDDARTTNDGRDIE
jgi:hypothetical protein